MPYRTNRFPYRLIVLCALLVLNTPHQNTASETDLVSGSADESSGDSHLITDSDSTSIDQELEAQLAALSDEELTALAEALEKDEGQSSKYPPVPEGFPETPVWFEDYFDETRHAKHVTMYRVLIELWNRGDRDFVSGVYEHHNGRVYPLYQDVVYVEWDSYTRDGPDGEPIEVKYISGTLGTHDTIGDVNDAGEDLFTEEEIMSGAYKTKYPDLKLVDYDSAGYDPASILNDY